MGSKVISSIMAKLEMAKMSFDTYVKYFDI